jgi:hypothetical protein
MNRRSFIQLSAMAAPGFFRPDPPRTRHVIFIINGGGVRKKEYYEDGTLGRNLRKLARDGFTFTEDHCERVASHEEAFTELVQGRACEGGRQMYPTMFDYIGSSCMVRSIDCIVPALANQKPRLVLCRETGHDIAHHQFEMYVNAVKRTDEAVGRVFDWVRNHPYFSRHTTIVVRPEFGRDDEVNRDGSLHHSYGFYYTHRVATIFWGPDFNKGVDSTTVLHACDMAPTLTKLFGIDAMYAEGRVAPGLFRNDSDR